MKTKSYHTPHRDKSIQDDKYNKRIAIKWNNAATNDPCAFCWARTDPQIGPEFFVADSWQLVCNDCAERYAPGLFALLELLRDQHSDEIEAQIRAAFRPERSILRNARLGCAS